MRKKKAVKRVSAILLAAVTFLSCLGISREDYQAATSYTNAKEFYNSTEKSGISYHSECYDGMWYYATCAKLASSSSNLKYYTLGFDITVTGNGKTADIAVKRATSSSDSGSLKQISSVSDGTYEYILYRIDTATLYSLVKASAGASTANSIFSASSVYVTANAIMTTKQGSAIKGSISENSSGGVNLSGTTYRLKYSSDLSAIKEKFSGHTFESYVGIDGEITNYSINIQYMINGTDAANVGCSSTAAVGNGYTSSGGVLYKNGSPVITSCNVLNTFTLFNPSTASLTKTGYHLESGKEWIYSSSTYSATNTYMPKDICSDVGTRNRNIYMYANWKANTYTVTYKANGGSGTVSDSTLAYDSAGTLRENTYTRTGYTLKTGEEWNTKADGTGTSYSSAQAVQNMTTTNGATITLYANWVPCVYQITADKQNGTGGTDTFYEKYNTGFYSNSAASSKITSITLPTRKGYDFQGYFTNISGVGDPIVTTAGLIHIAPTYYTQNARVYASWQAKQFLITFDKQGGTGGTSSAVATYDELLPCAEAPYKAGYSFKGYYLDDTQYYTEFMAPTTTYQHVNDITLTASWVDDIPPVTGISVSTSSWTNRAQGIDIVASAFDLGTGLSKVELYCGDTLVASKTNLKGTNDTIVLEYTHTVEGAYRYKVIAYDMEGNVSESYETCQYDITAPTGSYSVENSDPTDFSLNVDASDYNVP